MSKKRKKQQKQQMPHPQIKSSEGNVIKFSHYDALLFLGALALYLVSRAWGISTFPIHYDEASYLHWGNVILNDWNQRFIMAAWGGKQPLFIWMISLFNAFIPDLILAGRLVAISAGIATIIAMWLIAQRVFDKTVAWFGVFLYIAAPFSTLFDRVAILDGFLTCLAMWSLYLSLRVSDNPWFALPLALVIGASLLTKTSSLIYLPLISLGPLTASNFRSAYRHAFSFLAVAGLGGYAIYFLFFGNTEGARFVSQFEEFRKYNLSLEELLAIPLSSWVSNIGATIGYFWGLLTPALALIAAPAMVWAISLQRRDVLLLATWVLFPIVAFDFIARVLFSRYFVFVVPPLDILIAAFLVWLAQALRARVPISVSPVAIATLLLVLLSIYPFWQTLTLAFSPASVSLPASSDVDEYIDHATFGIWAARDFVRAQARAGGSCYVLSHWLYGNVRDAVYAVFSHDPGIKTLSIVPVQGGRLVPQSSTFVVIDPYVRSQSIYSPRVLSQQSCLFYILDTDKVDQEIAYRDALSLVGRFSNLKDYGAIGVYTIRFDERFLNP